MVTFPNDTVQAQRSRVVNWDRWMAFIWDDTKIAARGRSRRLLLQMTRYGALDGTVLLMVYGSCTAANGILLLSRWDRSWWCACCLCLRLFWMITVFGWYCALVPIIYILLFGFVDRVLSAGTISVSRRVVSVEFFHGWLCKLVKILAVWAVQRCFALINLLVVTSTTSTAGSLIAVHLVVAVEGFVSKAVAPKTLRHRIAFSKLHRGPSNVESEVMLCNLLINTWCHFKNDDCIPVLGEPLARHNFDRIWRIRNELILGEDVLTDVLFFRILTTCFLKRIAVTKILFLTHAQRNILLV